MWKRLPKNDAPTIENRRAKCSCWVTFGIMAIMSLVSLVFVYWQILAIGKDVSTYSAMNMAALALADKERWVRSVSKNEVGSPAVDSNGTTAPNSDECTYGVVVPVALRKDKEGNVVEYWRDVVENIPSEIRHVYVFTRLQQNRPKHPRIFRVIVSDAEYPDLDPGFLGRPVRRNHGDSEDKVKWRSSLTLDFAFALRYVGATCKYVLWIEDDAILPKGWFERVKDVQRKHDNWTFDLIASSGAVGLLANSRIAQSLSQYLIHHFDHSPFDWLFDFWERSYFMPTHPDWAFSRRLHIVGHRGTVSTLGEADARPFIPPDL